MSTAKTKAIRLRREFSELELQAIGARTGGGMATREGARLWLHALIEATLDDVVEEYQLAESVPDE